MSVKVKWHGSEYMRKINSRIEANLERAAITFKNEVKQVLSRAGQRGKLKRQHRNVTITNRSVSRRYGKTGRLLGLMVRSRPFEPPRRQTGTLRMRIAHEMNNQVARVGTNLRYARYLERGTRGGKTIVPKIKAALANTETGEFFGKKVRQGAIRPRPFMAPTLARMRMRLDQIIKKGF